MSNWSDWKQPCEFLDVDDLGDASIKLFHVVPFLHSRVPLLWTHW